MFKVDESKFTKTIEDLRVRGDIVAEILTGVNKIQFETNGSGEDDCYYEVVIYEEQGNAFIEVWHSDCIYEEEKPQTSEELEALMLGCLELL
jgi:hypothetical protein